MKLRCKLGFHIWRQHFKQDDYSRVSWKECELCGEKKNIVHGLFIGKVVICGSSCVEISKSYFAKNWD